LETGEHLEPIEQAAHDREMLGRAGSADEGMRPGQLDVAGGRRAVEGPKSVFGKHPQRRLGVRRIAIDPDRRRRLREEILDNANVRLAMTSVGNQRAMVSSWDLRVA